MCSINFPDDAVLFISSLFRNTGFTITPSSMTFYEYDPAGTFSVALNTDPLVSVTIPLSSAIPTKATVSPPSLIFDSTNWSLPQDVTVTPQNDTVVDADANFSIILGTVTGSGSPYEGLNPPDVTVTVLNNDKRIFRTIVATTGSLGGIAGADSTCGTRGGVLGIVNSKAIISAASRTASPQLDWVLKPFFSYYREADGLPIMTTNSNAIFTFGNLTNQWDGASTPNYWTGMNVDWTAGANCLNWTSSSNLQSGSYGKDSLTNSGAISGFTTGCDISANMYILCAEQ